MKTEDQVQYENGRKHDIQERPQVLGIHAPAVFENRSALIEDLFRQHHPARLEMSYPASAIDVKDCFDKVVVRCVLGFLCRHNSNVQGKQYYKLTNLDEISRPWDDQSILIQQPSTPGIV